LKKCFKNLTIEQIILFVISIIVFIFAVYSFNEQSQLTSIAMMIFMSIFVLIASVNPNTLLNFILVQNKDGIEVRFNRHEATDSEIKEAIQLTNKVEDSEAKEFDLKDLENSVLVEAAQNRSFEERSDVDFLLIATKLRKNKEYESALRQAYAGLNISKNYKIKSLLEFRISSIFYDFGDMNISMSLLYKAIEIDNSNSKAYSALGTLLVREGKKDEAQKMYDQAINIDSNNFQAYFNLGFLLSNDGKKDEAQRMYEKAILIDENYFQAYNNLANLLSEQDKTEEAEKIYRKAIEINKNYEIGYRNLAILLKKKGQIEEATKLIKQADELKNSIFNKDNNSN
jgi:Flp pilus assembly protein TadD